MPKSDVAHSVDGYRSSNGADTNTNDSNSRDKQDTAEEDSAPVEALEGGRILESWDDLLDIEEGEQVLVPIWRS